MVTSESQTVVVDNDSNFSLTPIQNFTVGTVSEPDVFDFASELVSGNGTVVSASNNLTLSSIDTDSDSISTRVSSISKNNTGLIEFIGDNGVICKFDLFLEN